jgi:predicted ATP-grasp superfamily ATP-dependent carboligase
VNGFVQERAILSNLKDPVLLAAFATPTRSGSTAASALSYLIQHWQAEPVLEFGAEHLYSYARIRPQLVTNEDGTRQLQWPSNTVFLARPEGLDRSFLILVGVEPSLGWQELIERIEAFCRRNGVTTSIMLHSAPAGVSHRQSTPVVAVYGSQELQNSFGLPQTIFHDGPMSFAAVLSLHLNAAGCQTTDLIALEPFYTPGLPDAQAALALIGIIDRHFGTRTPVETLAETANSQREVYERAVAGSEQLSSLAERLEQSTEPMMLDERAGDGNDLSLGEVMDEVDQILSGS